MMVGYAKAMTSVNILLTVNPQLTLSLTDAVHL